jgi:hypothetical protein
VRYTTICSTQSSVPVVGQNNCPKQVELTGIINKPLLLHLVGLLVRILFRRRGKIGCNIEISFPYNNVGVAGIFH